MPPPSPPSPHTPSAAWAVVPAPSSVRDQCCRPKEQQACTKALGQTEGTAHRTVLEQGKAWCRGSGRNRRGGRAGAGGLQGRLGFCFGTGSMSLWLSWNLLALNLQQHLLPSPPSAVLGGFGSPERGGGEPAVDELRRRCAQGRPSPSCVHLRGGKCHLWAHSPYWLGGYHHSETPQAAQPPRPNIS